jgi:hypothetical protein
MDISGVISGVLAGVVYGLSTFAKKEGQDFDWKKFGTTLIIGAVAGAGTGIMNMPIDATYMYMVNLGAVGIVENALKILYRKLLSKISLNPFS